MKNSNNYKEYKLKEICSFIRRGKQPKYIKRSSIKVLNQNAIRWEHLANDKLKFHDEQKEIREEYFLKKNDIVVNSTGVGTMGRAYHFDCNPDNIFADSHITIIRTKKNKLDSKYLYYLLKTPYVQEVINKIATGSTGQRELNKSAISNVVVSIPSIKIQREVIKILAHIDKKIELNNKINQTLENISQAIFKHWFIDYEFPNQDGLPYKSSGGEMVESELGMIPNDWDLVTLKDITRTIESGRRPSGGVDRYSKGIPSIGAENIIGLGKYDYSKNKYVPYEFYQKLKKGIVKNSDVLLYKDGAKLGRKSIFLKNFPFKKCCINSHVFILRTTNQISPYFLYFWLDTPLMTKKIKDLNTNSAQPGINIKGVQSLMILKLGERILNKFNFNIKPMVEKIMINSLENRKLGNIRDLLLPKLMSGKIRINIPERNKTDEK